jgi:hypothetical protein
MQGNHGSLSVKGSPIDRMTRTCLAGELKTQMCNNADDLFGGNSREPFGY